MYSMFDLLFDTNVRHQPVYVISDSEMKELKKKKQQDELDCVIDQRKKLEEAYKSQMGHLEERERELRKGIKGLNSSKGNI